MCCFVCLLLFVFKKTITQCLAIFSKIQSAPLSRIPFPLHTISGLAAAYRRQFQYEDQQQKSHLQKVNEVFHSKAYTSDGIEFFSNKEEMNKFYKGVVKEQDKLKEGSRALVVKNRFKKATGGMMLFKSTISEKPAKPHSDVMEEKVRRKGV